MGWFNHQLEDVLSFGGTDRVVLYFWIGMIEESSALKYEDGCNFVTHDTCSFVMVQGFYFL